MQPKSKKTALVRHIDPDKYIQEDKHRRPHMPHRAAILILTNRGDSLFLVRPRIAVENGDSYIRVPPQNKLMGSGTLYDTASLMLRDALCHRIHRDEITYVGSTHGNKYKGGHVVPHAKMIHWLAVQIPRGRKIFNADSRAYDMGYWCTQNQLLSLEGVSMSARKYTMTLQAILGYAALGEQVKLARAAEKKLEVV